ncbi:hypothetical protein [Priestia abyssalis]|nr:hypothetical protein [Priestia abyssalis]
MKPKEGADRLKQLVALLKEKGIRAELCKKPTIIMKEEMKEIKVRLIQ